MSSKAPLITQTTSEPIFMWKSNIIWPTLNIEKQAFTYEPDTQNESSLKCLCWHAFQVRIPNSNFYTLCFAIQTYELVHVKFSSATLCFHETTHQHLFSPTLHVPTSFWSICVTLCCKSTLIIGRNLLHSLIGESKTSHLPFPLKRYRFCVKWFSLKKFTFTKRSTTNTQLLYPAAGSTFC